jgi:hypothetical protein
MAIQPYTIYSKTGKGVQEASGKTGLLARNERSVLQQIDGKTSFADLQQKFEKTPPAKFEALIQQLDNDGFIREVQSSAPRPAPPPPRPAPPAPSGGAPPAEQGREELDFTNLTPTPPKPSAPARPTVDFAAQARAGSERQAREQAEVDFHAREEAVARARAEAEAKARAEMEAKVKAAREAAVRAAAEAKARAEVAERERRAAAEREREVVEKARREAEELKRQLEEEKARAEAERKAREEAERRAREEAQRQAKEEAERKTREEEERRAREEGERRAREEIERQAREAAERERAAQEQARKEAEERARREAEELRRQLEAERRAREESERKAKEEAERREKEEAERKTREEAERRAREESERQAREEAERRAREESERKAKEEAERREKEEAERKNREEAERRAREESERKAREEAERRAREEGERKAKDEAERKAREETERKAREEAERRAKEEAERKAREAAERERAAQEQARREAEEKARREAEEARKRSESELLGAKDDDAARRRAASARALVSKAPSAASLDESLLADLDSFAKADAEASAAKEAEARAAREATERASKEAAGRAAVERQSARAGSREEARREAEEARRKAREEQGRLAMSAADREAQADADRERTEQAEERRRRAREAVAGTVLEQAVDEELLIDDRELGFDEIEREMNLLKRVEGRRRKPILEEPAPAAAEEAETEEEPARPAPRRRAEVATGARARADEFAAPGAERPRVPWVKYAVMAFIGLLVVGIGGLHLMPISPASYEKAATEALGVPVRIGAVRMSLITGIQMKFERVSVGDVAQIGLVRAHGGLGALMGEQKLFDEVELEGASLSESRLGDALFGALKGGNLKIARVTAKQLKLTGPLALPDLDVDLTVGGNGAAQSITVSGPDALRIKMVPGDGGLSIDGNAQNFTVPFVPGLSLAEFAVRGRATLQGVNVSKFDGRVFEGVVSGSANVRWGEKWSVEGQLSVRNLNAAVFAPALLSEGRAEGRGLYAMSGTGPGALAESAHLEGSFTIQKGVLGSFDLSRAIQTNGAQSAGRTLFNELTAQGVYDGGAVQLRNVVIAAGPLNAGASLDVAVGGGLNGRILADIKTPAKVLRAALAIGGTTQEPALHR